jgi:ribosomal-protein-alanine N-acetyltransferase
MNLAVRPMQLADIKQVREIDRQAFPSLETSVSFKRELHNEIAKYIVAYEPGNSDEVAADQKTGGSVFSRTLGRILQFALGPAPTSQKIVGFAGIWLMAGEAHLITIAVREDYRRLSVGEYLLQAVINTALQNQASLVTLEVSTSNTAAQSLYEKYGLYASGRRKQYYSDTGEDAIIMTTDDINTEEFKKRFVLLKNQLLKRFA